MVVVVIAAAFTICLVRFFFVVRVSLLLFLPCIVYDLFSGFPVFFFNFFLFFG